MIGEKLALFFDSWELFSPAVYAGVVAGLTLGLIGVYVVLRRVVFLTATVSQTAGFGVAAAFYCQIHLGLHLAPMAGATLATLALVAAVIFAWGRRNTRIDSLLGVGFITGMAGTLALGTRIVQEVHDIQTLLFGSAVAVMPDQLQLLLLVSVPLLLVHLWFWSGFVTAAFDRDGGAIRGVPVRLLDATFFATLALAVAVSTRVLGVLPTFAFSVLPGMAAVRVAPNIPWSLAIAACLGAVVGFLGYLTAFVFELPVGASQALVAALLVGLADIGYRLSR